MDGGLGVQPDVHRVQALGFEGELAALDRINTARSNPVAVGSRLVILDLLPVLFYLSVCRLLALPPFLLTLLPLLLQEGLLSGYHLRALCIARGTARRIPPRRDGLGGQDHQEPPQQHRREDDRPDGGCDQPGGIATQNGRYTRVLRLSRTETPITCYLLPPE